MTATATGTATQHDANAIFERARELNERFVDASRRAGTVYVDATERAWRSLADYEERVGRASNLGWVASLTQAQADLTRAWTDAYASTARDLLR
jgi:hypothetical protein